MADRARVEARKRGDLRLGGLDSASGAGSLAAETMEGLHEVMRAWTRWAGVLLVALGGVGCGPEPRQAITIETAQYLDEPVPFTIRRRRP